MNSETKRVPVRAGHGAAIELRAGERLRVRNPPGSQVVDTFAFNRADLTEHMSMEHTRAGTRHIGIRPGMALLTNQRRPILEVTEDTSPGVHDTLIAACDVHRYRLLGHVGAHRNCRDNLAQALAPYGEAATPCPLNLFMNIEVQADGTLAWRAPVSRPGDCVEFRALMDCVVVLSACPMDLLPINGEECIPRDVEADVLPA